MPFLHGFRRIVYEYQPLVDAVLCAVGLQEDAGTKTERSTAEDGVSDSLEEVLAREAQSAVFVEGISCALFKVAEGGLVGAAEVLLRYGADLNFEDPVSYYNPLHIAVLRNRPLMVRLLVQHGADVNKRDRIHESSPLDLACEEADRLPCLRVLLTLGANVNAQDKNGKTALLHALASSDGLTVKNTDNIRLLLEGGASVQACTSDEETVMSSLVFLVKETFDSSDEDAAEIGRFCLCVTELLLDHGADPSCSWSPRGPEGAGEEEEEEEEEHAEPSLTQTCLEHFDLLFPLAVLLLQRGVSLQCPRHGAPCWSGPQLLLRRLEAALRESSSAAESADLLARAEALLDLAQTCCTLTLPVEPPHPVPHPHPHPQPPPEAVLELRAQLVEQETRPPPLRLLCRRLLRRCLLPWPLEPKVRQLPLPDRLKDFLLPETSMQRRPRWDRCRPSRNPPLMRRYTPAP
ncbi:ankyrin repeat and SOCS box protein 6 isoform X2 [Clupea harengus]|nr:ankyrin repeat and SOCS box protein 6 isoform X2 [Clupea harengus]XP_031426804.1 ankyrin repeat and SOCS box protein 6 isoform X2 [Clupea harengus]XP_031426805.1 ankyrin repeat and SOCS box protein 6 isoform X2 [Clupea harengus]